MVVTNKCGFLSGLFQPCPSCSNYTRTMQNFAYTSCSSAMFVSIVLDVGNRQVFYV